MRPALVPDHGGGPWTAWRCSRSLLSHEGPFGVGYAVALFPVPGRDETRRYAAACEQIHKERLQARRAKEDPFVRLARLSLETYIRKGHPLQALPENLAHRTTKSGRRGFCFAAQRREAAGLHRDNPSPPKKMWAWEIVQNAISAGTRDPRFPAVRAGELDELTYSVDVLSPPEPVESPRPAQPQTVWRHCPLWTKARTAAAGPGWCGYRSNSKSPSPGKRAASGKTTPTPSSGLRVWAALMKVTCPLCFHHCTLSEGQTGACRARGNRNGYIGPAQLWQTHGPGP